MNNQFNHEKVFIHWPFDEHGFKPPYEFGLTVVHDHLYYPGSSSLEERFLRSGADIALIDAYVLMRSGQDDLLKSDILKARSVCVKFPLLHEKSDKFHQQLDDLGFLTLWVRELQNKPKLASFFVRALENIKVTS